MAGKAVTRKSGDAKLTAQEATALRSELGKRGANAGDLDTLLAGKAGNKSRREMVADLVAWLKQRPKAK